MHRFTAYPVAVFLVLCASLMCTSQPKNLEERIDAVFAEWNKPDSPGVSLAVIRDGKILYAKGYGMADLEHNVPITPDTVFYIGSTSKQFVAMCILLLEEQGKISLDDDIRKYLPDFPQYDRPMTIRHLIHHTSGLRDDLTLWSLSGQDVLDSMPEEAVYEQLRRQKALNFPPGEQHLYSNSCYLLLAIIVRKASGESLSEYAEKNIFRPLGMNSSVFQDDNTRIIKNRAFGYTRLPDGRFGNLPMRFALVGSGGLYTSVNDLFKWDQNFYDNQLGLKSAELIRKMHQNGKLNNGTEVNYAFALGNGTYRGLRTVSHGGALGGYVAELTRFPDQRFSIILLCNLNTIGSTQLVNRVADVCLENLLTPEPKAPAPKAPAERKEIAIDPSVLDRYVGKYQLSPGMLLEVTREDDRLMGQLPGDPVKTQLFPESMTKFFAKIVDAQFTFEPDQKRAILHVGGNDIPLRRSDGTSSPQDLSEFVGDYYSDELQVTYHILKEESLFYLKFGNRPRQQMQPAGKDMAIAGFMMQFQRNEKGEVNGFKINAGRVQNLQFVKSK